MSDQHGGFQRFIGLRPRTFIAVITLWMVLFFVGAVGGILIGLNPYITGLVLYSCGGLLTVWMVGRRSR